jgi:RNA-directed DNA polymerase
MIVELAARRLALPVPFLLKVAATASHRYKTYAIPKKTGGERTIHHPARELKLIQGWLLHNVLSALPVHGAATAYRKGSNIRRNAIAHATNNYLLRVDFQDFFPSLRRRDVTGLLKVNRQRLAPEVTDGDIAFVTSIVCRGDSLTIGAPTSPQLSNAIMFGFDEVWSRNAEDAGVTYTRYADDLYFSTNRPNVLGNLLNGLRAFVQEVGSPALRINDRKTAFSSRKRRRLVAGLVLTSSRTISIGRKKKRLLKSLVWKFIHGELTPPQIASLRGSISYLRSVEPTFIETLQRKYSIDMASADTWPGALGSRPGFER